MNRIALWFSMTIACASVSTPAQTADISRILTGDGETCAESIHNFKPDLETVTSVLGGQRTMSSSDERSTWLIKPIEIASAELAYQTLCGVWALTPDERSRLIETIVEAGVPRVAVLALKNAPHLRSEERARLVGVIAFSDDGSEIGWTFARDRLWKLGLTSTERSLLLDGLVWSSHRLSLFEVLHYDGDLFDTGLTSAERAQLRAAFAKIDDLEWVPNERHLKYILPGLHQLILETENAPLARILLDEYTVHIDSYHKKELQTLIDSTQL